MAETTVKDVEVIKVGWVWLGYKIVQDGMGVVRTWN